jgi:two-component system phosphate regulon sensor histidine kinase PhoR
MPLSQNKKQQKIRQLIELNDELENYFKNTIIPQLFVDADLILRKFTPPAMKQFNFSPEDLGKPFTHLVDNIRYSTIVDDVHQVIESGEVLEKEIQTTDFKWFQMNIIPYLIEKEKKTNGVVITFVDITDRIKTLKELEKLNASHKTFIYSVSHDLKAPLSNIEGLIKYLLEYSDSLLEKCEQDNQEQQRIAAMLDKSIGSMRNIIEELSETIKIENDFKEEVESVRFENIINEVKMTLNDKIYANHAKIHLDINEQEINFSRKNIRSIIYNLLSNAIKYKSPDRIPEIHLKTERVDGHTQISVKDNGLGIAEDKLDLLFTPYSRLEKKVEGTGIGLYLVKKIIENEGGHISVDSKLGEGSEFIVKLRAH